MLIDTSKANIIIEKDPTKQRKTDITKLEGNNTKFKKQTGWIPKYDIKNTLVDVINFWRDKLNR